MNSLLKIIWVHDLKESRSAIILPAPDIKCLDKFPVFRIPGTRHFPVNDSGYMPLLDDDICKAGISMYEWAYFTHVAFAICVNQSIVEIILRVKWTYTIVSTLIQYRDYRTSVDCYWGAAGVRIVQHDSPECET
jgi:hypothetical protein